MTKFSGVQNWMFRNADQYETATGLAEAAADQFNLYENTRDYTIPERVFELAAFVKPTESAMLRSQPCCGLRLSVIHP